MNKKIIIFIFIFSFFIFGGARADSGQLLGSLIIPANFDTIMINPTNPTNYYFLFWLNPSDPLPSKWANYTSPQLFKTPLVPQGADWATYYSWIGGGVHTSAVAEINGFTTTCLAGSYEACQGSPKFVKGNLIISDENGVLPSEEEPIATSTATFIQLANDAISAVSAITLFSINTYFAYILVFIILIALVAYFGAQVKKFGMSKGKKDN